MKLNDRKQIKVYLESEDLARVTRLANEKRRAVSEYVRDLILEDLGEENREEAVPRVTGVKPRRGRKADRVVQPGGAPAIAEGVEAGVAGPDRAEATVGTLKRGVPEVVKGKTCKHGKEKGYRCWQCGGLAEVVA